jgi:hypothetical protein
LPAILAAAGLVFSFAQAPFAHVHRHDPDHRHATALPHSHWRLIDDRHAAVDAHDDEDDAQAIDWFVMAEGSGPPFVAVTSEPLETTAPAMRHERMRPPVPRAHDPPAIRSLPPRSPPEQ